MTTLHFVFGPHFRGKGAHMLWHTMHELGQRNRLPAFVAMEGLGMSEAQARDLEATKASHAHLYAHWPRKPMGLTEFEEKLEGVARKSRPTLDQIGHKMDELGTESIPGVFNRPIRFIEASEHGVRIRVPSDEFHPSKRIETEPYLQELRNRFDEYTRWNIQRHEVATENIRRQLEQHGAEKEGDVVISFGFEHEGMEAHVKELLEKRGIKVSVKTTTGGVQKTLWDKMRSERYRKPAYEPSNEELAKAQLHRLLCLGMHEAIQHHLSEQQDIPRDHTNHYHFQYLAEKEPEYQRHVALTEKLVKAMTPAQVRTELEALLETGVLDVSEFLEKYSAGSKKDRKKK